MEYTYLAISWIMYYSLHSILATDRAKTIVQSQLGNPDSWRIIYSVVSTLGLFALLFLMATISESLLWRQNTALKLVSMISITYGLIVVKLAFKGQSITAFLTKEDRFDERSELKVSGIYGKVRHPLYSGTILIFIGLFLFIPKISTLIALIVTLLYLLIGIPIEEKKLILKFGDQYLSYKKKVPSLIPWFR